MMTNLLILGLGLSFTIVLGQDLTVDLRSGAVSQKSTNNGLSWVTRPENPRSYSPVSYPACGCHMQAVLKLTFDTASRRRAEIRMQFENSNDWSFNIGDSRTNNGYGGDAGTQNSDAEIHAKGKELLFYGKDIYGKRGQSYGHLYTRKNFLTHDVTVNVQDELVTADNGDDFLYINTFKTFNLNGQPDSEGPVNYDVYMGMNRVIAGSYRSGTGLCRVEITWHAN